jgi:hypothetical protein
VTDDDKPALCGYRRHLNKRPAAWDGVSASAMPGPIHRRPLRPVLGLSTSLVLLGVVERAVGG